MIAAAHAVRQLEVAIALSPTDVLNHRDTVPELAEIEGYTCSGSFAGRNIDNFYLTALKGKVPCSLSGAVHACFGDGAASSGVKHVLVTSGFFVLHELGAAPVSGIHAGSCETDGPLGAMALLRAFAMRGVHVSLFSEPHNGPVMRQAHAAMLQWMDRLDPAMSERLRRFVRLVECDGRPYQGAPLREQMLAQCADLNAAVGRAWPADQHPGPIDCLFALERLGAPYKNIRGLDISAHTEPIDCIWPFSSPPPGTAAQLAMSAWMQTHGLVVGDVETMRAAAGVVPDALTLGVGDGGNEVGMGRIVHLDGAMGALKPSGNSEYVATSVNGCYRSCDHVLLATVSNWAGSAFELASRALLGAPANGPDHVALIERAGVSLADLEKHVLQAICAPPARSVDGVFPEREMSIDGMPFEPKHRDLYTMLWRTAKSSPNGW